MPAVVLARTRMPRRGSSHGSKWAAAEARLPDVGLKLPAERLSPTGRREEGVYDLGIQVPSAAVCASVEQKLQQHIQLARSREETCMPRDAAECVKRVGVVDLTAERAPPPSVPRLSIGRDAITERRVVHHSLLVGIAV